MTIAIDFDGTIVHDSYPKIGEEMFGAVAAIKRMKEAGHYLILWTCRYGQDLTDAINWLHERGVYFDRINAAHPVNIEIYGNDTRKVSADVYVDDRMVGGFPGWATVEKYIADKVIGKKFNGERSCMVVNRKS